MTKASTLILKLTLIALALGAGVLILYVFPLGIRTDQTGEYRYIVMGLYLPAIPFLIALFKSYKLLEHIEKNQVFSEFSVSALRSIKYCGLTISALFAAGMPFIFKVADKDDAPGVVAIALVIIFASFVIATGAGVFQSLMQKAIEMKSENDLTV